MGGVCSTYGERREVCRGRDHLEDTGIDGSIILRRIFKKWDLG
jgi:hypothetical protein